MNDLNKKILHGNMARIDPKKPVKPLWSNVISSNYPSSANAAFNPYGRTYHRLDDEEEYEKFEVDSNPL